MLACVGERERAKTGNMISFVVRKTIVGQMEPQDFLNTDGREEFGEFGVSFRITVCLSREFLLSCTFAPCLVLARIGGHQQAELRACLSKKPEHCFK